jgi:hypothetical protein
MSKTRRNKILFTSAGWRVASNRAFRESLHRLGLLNFIKPPSSSQRNLHGQFQNLNELK